ncbi:sulfonate ABC transporter [Kaistia sp. 32K]|uniref:ABC transporter permease n=1 Tax=Kaistia sp. 32K TaxID=2795690 RepID=UPI001916B251|nr:ABC transporter permease [Kaistia sp. 32K]BCP52185.1 sulfonate ABC transporter [Kaistia sp. 32K]
MSAETETLRQAGFAGPSPRGRRASLARGLLLPWLSPIAILLVWWFVSAIGLVGPKALPSPVQVIAAGWELTLNGKLPQALVASLARVLAGTLLGVALGLAAGLLAGYYRVAQIAVDKPLQMLRAVPFNALVPLFIVAFGIGEWMKVSLIAVGVLVPIYLNTFAGVRNVDSKLVEVGLVYRVPRRLIATKILFLGALPSILTGLRFSLAIAWIALVTSETVNANAGIGFILAQAQRFVRTDQVFLCIVIYALLGILTDYLVRLLEGRLLAWRNSYDGR